MTMTTTTEILNQIFCFVFDDDTVLIRPDMTANDVDGWDSLSHINLITTIEAKFDIRFTQKELLKQRNVGNLIDDINRKLKA
jgi:acyl carrier protein